MVAEDEDENEDEDEDEDDENSRLNWSEYMTSTAVWRKTPLSVS